MKNLIEKLEYGVSPRETLASLADRLGGMLPVEIEESHIPLMNFVPAYFESEDAKTRKNAARVIGFVEDPLVPSILIRAFQKETVLYVRPQYLKSLKNFTIEQPICDILAARRDQIQSAEVSAEDRKHLNEELMCLTECLTDDENGKHTFTGWSLENEVLFMIDKPFIEITDREITDEPKKKVLPTGIMLKTRLLDRYLPIRTYREILFFLPGLKTVSDDPYAAVMQLMEAGFVKFLKDRHSGEGAFGYRIEMKGVEDKKKSVLIKRLSGEILRLSEHQLVMRKDDYEVELRFLLREDGTYRFFFKLFTLEENRFAYRKEAVAASIKPVTAAAFLKLYEKYIKKNARVLDPFCGVGTMLFERNILSPVTVAFGVDTYGEAIDKARRNGNESEYPIYFIHRDFFDFRHDSLFDEIVTDMPFSMNPDDLPKIDTIYYRFFGKAKDHLEDGSYVFLLSRNPDLVRKYASGIFRIEEHVTLAEKTGLTGFVLKKL
ncbi:MAG: methyltransferase [Lachnospiraceae bacterium]|nr:methyltransferase [Lachnospiraceae bacterium]